MVNNPTFKRFESYAVVIDIKKLERETLKLLYIGLVVAVAFHAALAALFTYKRTEVRVAKPIQVELIVRRPRMTRPFLINKKDILKRMLMRRNIIMRMPSGKFKFKSPVSVEDLMKIIDNLELDTKIDAETITEVIAEIDSSLFAEIKFKFEKEYYFDGDIGFKDTITREPENFISLKDELLTIDNLDLGEYKAIVVKDPENKQNLKGFVYIPVDIWGSSLRPAEDAKTAIIALMSGFKKYTGIQVKTDKHVYIDSPEILKYPFIYITSEDLTDFNPGEIRSFREYIVNGGFALLEGYGRGYMPLRQLVRDSLGEFALYPVPVDHAVYHSFFDFETEPELFPVTDEIDDFNDSLPLQGIWFNGRLAGIFSAYELGTTWAGYSFENPLFRIGVNMIVFALLHDGSVAKKYINTDSLEENNMRAVP